MPDPSEFARKAKKGRLEAGVSQRNQDKALGLGSGWTSRFEKGDIQTPPAKTVCHALAKKHDKKPSAYWAMAAPERLRHLDPDLWTWHREALASVRPGVGALPESLVELVEEVSEFDRVTGDDESIAAALSIILTSLGTHGGYGSDAENRSVKRVAAALHRLAELPMDAELRLWEMFASQVELAADLVAEGARAGRGR